MIKPKRHHWRHSAETSLLGSGALLAAAAAAHAAHWPALPVLGGSVLAGGVVVIGSAWYGGQNAVNYALTTASAGLAWLAGVTIAGSPWPPAAVGALAALTAASIPAGAVVWAHNDEARDRLAAADAARSATAAARRITAALDRCGVPAVVSRVETTRAGRTAYLRLGGTSTTRSSLELATERIEVALSLRVGSVRFEGGDRASEVALHITDRDVLAEVVMYPAGQQPRSVNEPFPIGVRDDGSTASILFREVTALAVGVRGSGKSNLMNVLLAQLGYCVDVVIFAIDLKGGRTVRPWLQPWALGKTDRPLIDWVATSRDEVELMLTALVAGVHARASSLSGGKVIPSPERPAVVLLVDEVAVIFGLNQPKPPAGQASNMTLAALGSQYVQLGRSEAMDAVLLALRGTVTMTGGGDLKAQCRLRIGLGVSNASEAAFLIDGEPAAARLLARTRTPGVVLVHDGEQPLAPVKMYRLDGDADAARIADLATELGRIRPALDSLTADAMGTAYATRWDRPAAVMLKQQMRGDNPADDFEAVVAGLVLEEPDGERMTAAERAMLEILRKRRMVPITRIDLLGQLAIAGHKPAPETVSRWLAKHEHRGLLKRLGGGQWQMRKFDDRAA